MELDLATRQDLERVEAKLDRLLTILDNRPRTVTVADICKQLRMCSSSIRYDFPWLLPNFGKSQYPGIKKWDRDVWEDWNARPVEDRRREYLEHEKERTRRNHSS